MMSDVIKVGDIKGRISLLNGDIRREGNKIAKKRLLEEQAAYKLVLRNMKQYLVETPRTKIKVTV
tara:strand:- start:473 stop:667 length:195 start_codon:yes stop_codon:yes gene_type:complete